MAGAAVDKSPSPQDGDIYGGISDVAVPSESFDFGAGVTLAPTKAHFMRPCLMTFERPESSFPAWQSARGSFGFDIVGEIKVPSDLNIPRCFDRPNTVWWLAALLRLRATPRLRVPLLSNVSFTQALKSSSRSFWPVENESQRTRLVLEEAADNTLTSEILEWVRQHWIDGGQLMQSSQEFNLAFQALDRSSFITDAKLGLLLLWGALEGLFSPSTSELRFRISTNIATFLEPPRQDRAILQRKVAKLYDSRSAAAHGRADEAEGPLVATYALLKRVLLRIVNEKHVPTIEEIESALFGAEAIKIKA